DGASLESLSRGVVAFSRRYSLAELRERWGSLLYDSDVSGEASAAMTKLEIAKANGNEIKEASAADAAAPKRKRQSIRRMYYTMRKKIRTEVFFNTVDMALHDEMCIENNVTEKNIGGPGFNNINHSLNKDVNNNLFNYGNQLGLVGSGVGSSHSMSEDPLWKTIEDVSAPNMPVHVSLENENGGSESKEKIPHGSDALLNSANGDELMFMNIDEKAETAANKKSDDNVERSPCGIQGDDTSGVGEPQKLVAETKLAMANGPSAELEDVAISTGSSQGDSDFVFDCGNEVQSSGAAQSSHPKPANEFRFCSLNTEDPNVPSDGAEDVNESTGVPISLSAPVVVVPSSVNVSSVVGPSSANISAVVVPNILTPTPISIVKEVGYPDSSISNQRRNEPDRSLKRKDIPSKSFVASQSVRPGLVPNINSRKENRAAPKTENPAKNLISAVSRQSNVIVNPTQSRIVHANAKHSSYGLPAQEVIIALPSPDDTHPKEEEHKNLPDMEAKLRCIDQERGDDDDDDSDEDENDDEHEIPYFSDVEGMILEMDLDPADQDTNASTEVMRFQCEETKRTIMRLEQCAQSFVRRNIASRGALAVLYGRNLKKYIYKPEVIIGRSTEDTAVDIDLTRAGPYTHNISRRQASIRLDADGSFILKNLGKKSIFLNGKEIPKGHQRGLSDGSFIEIRDLSFIFDLNKECVERFIEDEDEDEHREMQG
ncbi:embryo defective 1967 protein, partial [Trifolium pratense]